MFRNSLKMLLSGGKSNRKNRNSGGSSTDSDCAFEGDYTVPPLPVTEGMQHIRIMEGVSRSLPSSPLLTHQAISMRLQPMKRLTGLTDVGRGFVCASLRSWERWRRGGKQIEFHRKLILSSGAALFSTALTTSVEPLVLFSSHFSAFEAAVFLALSIRFN